ncbi:MAG: hypothetical protein JW937_03930 [Candidatus Omnitrophica bacterium]|nr:hypothetical protein [Candidatus Omnitrophota bacterium]
MPQLEVHMEYLRAAQGIDTSVLSDELNQLCSRVQEALIETPQQRQLALIILNFGRIKNFFNLKFSPKAWQEYLAQGSEILPEQLRAGIRALGQEADLPVTFAYSRPEKELGWIALAEEFYRIAEERDQAMAQRTLAKMDELGLDRAVLITGGFHTAGMMRELQAQGISYCVAAPQVLSEHNEAHYEQMLQGKRASLNDLVKKALDNLTEEDAYRLLSALSPDLARAFAAQADTVVEVLNSPSGEALTTYLSAEYRDLASGRKAEAAARSVEGILAALSANIERTSAAATQAEARLMGFLAAALIAQQKAANPEQLPELARRLTENNPSLTLIDQGNIFLVSVESPEYGEQPVYLTQLYFGTAADSTPIQIQEYDDRAEVPNPQPGRGDGFAVIQGAIQIALTRQFPGDRATLYRAGQSLVLGPNLAHRVKVSESGQVRIAGMNWAQILGADVFDLPADQMAERVFEAARRIGFEPDGQACGPVAAVGPVWRTGTQADGLQAGATASVLDALMALSVSERIGRSGEPLQNYISDGASRQYTLADVAAAMQLFGMESTTLQIHPEVLRQALRSVASALLVGDVPVLLRVPGENGRGHYVAVKKGGDGRVAVRDSRRNAGRWNWMSPERAEELYLSAVNENGQIYAMVFDAVPAPSLARDSERIALLGPEAAAAIWGSMGQTQKLVIPAATLFAHISAEEALATVADVRAAINQSEDGFTTKVKEFLENSSLFIRTLNLPQSQQHPDSYEKQIVTEPGFFNVMKFLEFLENQLPEIPRYLNPDGISVKELQSRRARVRRMSEALRFELVPVLTALSGKDINKWSALADQVYYVSVALLSYAEEPTQDPEQRESFRLLRERADTRVAEFLNKIRDKDPVVTRIFNGLSVDLEESTAGAALRRAMGVEDEDAHAVGGLEFARVMLERYEKAGNLGDGRFTALTPEEREEWWAIGATLLEWARRDPQMDSCRHIAFDIAARLMQVDGQTIPMAIAPDVPPGMTTALQTGAERIDRDLNIDALLGLPDVNDPEVARRAREALQLEEVTQALSGKGSSQEQFFQKLQTSLPAATRALMEQAGIPAIEFAFLPTGVWEETDVHKNSPVRIDSRVLELALEYQTRGDQVSLRYLQVLVAGFIAEAVVDRFLSWLRFSDEEIEPDVRFADLGYDVAELEQVSDRMTGLFLEGLLSSLFVENVGMDPSSLVQKDRFYHRRRLHLVAGRLETLKGESYTDVRDTRGGALMGRLVKMMDAALMEDPESIQLDEAERMQLARDFLQDSQRIPAYARDTEAAPLDASAVVGLYSLLRDESEAQTFDALSRAFAQAPSGDYWSDAAAADAASRGVDTATAAVGTVARPAEVPGTDFLEINENFFYRAHRIPIGAKSSPNLFGVLGVLDIGFCEAVYLLVALQKKDEAWVSHLPRVMKVYGRIVDAPDSGDAVEELRALVSRAIQRGSRRNLPSSSYAQRIENRRVQLMVDVAEATNIEIVAATPAALRSLTERLHKDDLEFWIARWQEALDADEAAKQETSIAQIIHLFGQLLGKALDEIEGSWQKRQPFYLDERPEVVRVRARYAQLPPKLKTELEPSIGQLDREIELSLRHRDWLGQINTAYGVRTQMLGRNLLHGSLKEQIAEAVKAADFEALETLEHEMERFLQRLKVWWDAGREISKDWPSWEGLSGQYRFQFQEAIREARFSLITRLEADMEQRWARALAKDPRRAVISADSPLGGELGEIVQVDNADHTGPWTNTEFLVLARRYLQAPRNGDSRLSRSNEAGLHSALRVLADELEMAGAQMIRMRPQLAQDFWLRFQNATEEQIEEVLIRELRNHGLAGDSYRACCASLAAAGVSILNKTPLQESAKENFLRNPAAMEVLLLLSAVSREYGRFPLERGDLVPQAGIRSYTVADLVTGLAIVDIPVMPVSTTWGQIKNDVRGSSGLVAPGQKVILWVPVTRIRDIGREEGHFVVLERDASNLKVRVMTGFEGEDGQPEAVREFKLGIPLHDILRSIGFQTFHARTLLDTAPVLAVVMPDNEQSMEKLAALLSEPITGYELAKWGDMENTFGSMSPPSIGRPRYSAPTVRFDAPDPVRQYARAWEDLMQRMLVEPTSQQPNAYFDRLRNMHADGSLLLSAQKTASFELLVLAGEIRSGQYDGPRLSENDYLKLAEWILFDVAGAPGVEGSVYSGGQSLENRIAALSMQPSAGVSASVARAADDQRLLRHTAYALVSRAVKRAASSDNPMTFKSLGLGLHLNDDGLGIDDSLKQVLQNPNQEGSQLAGAIHLARHFVEGQYPYDQALVQGVPNSQTAEQVLQYLGKSDHPVIKALAWDLRQSLLDFYRLQTYVGAMAESRQSERDQTIAMVPYLDQAWRKLRISSSLVDQDVLTKWARSIVGFNRIMKYLDAYRRENEGEKLSGRTAQSEREEYIQTLLSQTWSFIVESGYHEDRGYTRQHAAMIVGRVLFDSGFGPDGRPLAPGPGQRRTSTRLTGRQGLIARPYEPLVSIKLEEGRLPDPQETAGRLRLDAFANPELLLYGFEGQALLARLRRLNSLLESVQGQPSQFTKVVFAQSRHHVMVDGETLVIDLGFLTVSDEAFDAEVRREESRHRYEEVLLGKPGAEGETEVAPDWATEMYLDEQIVQYFLDLEIDVQMRWLLSYYRKNTKLDAQGFAKILFRSLGQERRNAIVDLLSEYIRVADIPLKQGMTEQRIGQELSQAFTRDGSLEDLENRRKALYEYAGRAGVEGLPSSYVPADYERAIPYMEAVDALHAAGINPDDVNWGQFNRLVTAAREGRVIDLSQASVAIERPGLNYAQANLQFLLGQIMDGESVPAEITPLVTGTSALADQAALSTSLQSSL